jgi:hypothetical protein
MLSLFSTLAPHCHPAAKLASLSSKMEQASSTDAPCSQPSSTKKGLEHPRVQQCYNRGIEIYYEQLPDDQYSFSSSVSSASDESEITTTVRNQLYLARKLRSRGSATFFIPRSELNQLMTLDVVGSIVDSLLCCNELSPQDRQELTLEIRHGRGTRCRNPCLMLLTVLIGAEMEEQLMEFIEDGVTDYCLPLQLPGNSNRSTECTISGHEHNVLDGCNPNKLLIFGAWTYGVMAPYLKMSQGRHIHYIFNESDVLPIVEKEDVAVSQAPIIPQSNDKTSEAPIQQSNDKTSGTSRGLLGYGGFGEVQQIKFDPGHVDFDCYTVSKAPIFARRLSTDIFCRRGANLNFTL